MNSWPRDMTAYLSPLHSSERPPAGGRLGTESEVRSRQIDGTEMSIMADNLTLTCITGRAI